MFNNAMIAAGFFSCDALDAAGNYVARGARSVARGAAGVVTGAAQAVWNRLPTMMTAPPSPLRERVAVTRREQDVLPPPCSEFFALHDLLQRAQRRDLYSEEIRVFLEATHTQMVPFFDRSPALLEAVKNVHSNPTHHEAVGRLLSGISDWQSRVMVETMSFGTALVSCVSGMPSAEQCIGQERLNALCPRLANIPRQMPVWVRLMQGCVGERAAHAAVQTAQGLMLPPATRASSSSSSSSSSPPPAAPAMPWLTQMIAERLADVVVGAVGDPDGSRRGQILSSVVLALSQQPREAPGAAAREEPWLVDAIARTIASQTVQAFGGGQEAEEHIHQQISLMCQQRVNQVLGIPSAETQAGAPLPPPPMQGRFVERVVAATARAIVGQIGGGQEAEAALQHMMQGAFDEGMRSALGLPQPPPAAPPQHLAPLSMTGALPESMAKGIADMFVHMFGGGPDAYTRVHDGLMHVFTIGRNRALGLAQEPVDAAPSVVPVEPPVEGTFIPWISAQAADFAVRYLGGGEAARAAIEAYVGRQARGCRDSALGMGAVQEQGVRERPEAPQHGMLTDWISSAVGTASAALFGGGEALRADVEARSRRWLESQVHGRIAGVAAPAIFGPELPPVVIPDGPFSDELLAVRFALKELFRAQDDERDQIHYETRVLLWLIIEKHPYFSGMPFYQLERTLDAWYDRERKRQLAQKEGVSSLLWDEAKERLVGERNPMLSLDELTRARLARTVQAHTGRTTPLLEEKAQTSKAPGLVERGARAVFGDRAGAIAEHALHPRPAFTEDGGSVLGRFFSGMVGYLKEVRPDRLAIQCAAGHAIGQVEEALTDTTLNPEDKKALEELHAVLEKARSTGKMADAVETVQKMLTYYGVLPNPPPYDLRAPVFSMPKPREMAAPSPEAVRVSTQIEAKRFVRNTKHFATITALYNVFCSGSAKKRDPLDIPLIMQAASLNCSSDEQMDIAIREKFFSYLKRRSSFISYVVARLAYPVVSYILSFVLKHFTDSTLNWIENAIKKQKSIKASELPNVLVEGAQEYCGILLDIFRRIGTDPHRIVAEGSLNREIEKELERPEYHGGMTSNELYQKMGIYLIDKFLPNFGWPNKVYAFCRFISAQLPSSIQKVGFWVIRLFMSPFSVLAHVGQGLLSTFIGIVAKQSIKRLGLVEAVVGSGIEGLKFNGYAHALNTLLKEQLELLLETLESHYDPNTPKPVQDRDASYAGAMTAVYRSNLKALIPQAARLVARSGARSVEELQQMYQRPSMKQKAIDGIQDIFVQGRVLENAIVQVAESIETLIAPSRLQQVTADTLRVVNAAFQSGSQVDPKEFKATEEEVDHLIGRIIHKLIKEETEAALDLNKTREMGYANELNDAIVEEAKAICCDLSYVHYQRTDLVAVLKRHEEKLKELQNHLLAAAKKGFIGSKVQAMLHDRLHKIGAVLNTWDSDPSPSLRMIEQIARLIEEMPRIVLKPSLEWFPGREGISTQAAALLDSEIHRQVEMGIEAMRSKTYNVKGIVNLVCRKVLGIKTRASSVSVPAPAASEQS